MAQMVLASFLFAVMAAFARLAGGRIPSQEIVFFRAAIASVASLALVLRAREPILGHRTGLLAARGITGFLSLSLYFWSVLHLPFSEAVLLLQINPVFTALFAWWFLGERPGARFLPAALLVFSGVLLVAPPDLSGLAANAWVIVGLLSAVFAGSAYAEVRALSRTEHPYTIVLWFQMVSVLLSIPGTTLAGPVMPRGIEWLWLAGVGIFGQFGQVCLTRGLARVPAGRATLANPLVVGFGALIGWLLFHEGLDWGDLLGFGVLTAGLLLVGAGGAGPEPAGTVRPSADYNHR